MSEVKIPTTSVFATSETNANDVAKLIKEGLAHMSADGSINWAKLTTKIGYSRGWLIVRRAYLELNAPKLLVTLPTVSGDKDATLREWSKVITPMRDEQKLSWGEISVRVGKPESKIRTCYRATGAKKDIGLRIGKGGRFAYGEPEFYLEHRRAEGAMIPAEVKGKPAVEVLINAKNAQGKVVRANRVPATKKAAKRTVAA